MNPQAALSDALVAASPRLRPPPTPLVSLLIQGGVVVLWGLLFSRAFVLDGAFACAVGIASMAYHTALLGFVAWQTRGLARPALFASVARDGTSPRPPAAPGTGTPATH